MFLELTGLVSVISFFCLWYFGYRTYSYIVLVIAVAIYLIYYLINRFIKDYRRRNYLNSPLSKLDHLEGEKFEEYAKALFEEKGYKVQLTPKSHDYGADLLAKKNDELTVIQAKRYKNNVGVSAIQQIVAAKAYYKADKCIVITNHYFTKSAKKLARANNVKLIDRNNLYRK